MKSLLRIATLFLGLAVVLCSGGVQADDQSLGLLEMRSQSPLQQLRCGPLHHAPWILPSGTRTLSVHHTWKNLWLYEPGVYVIDAEVHEIVARYRQGLGSGFEVMAELPVRYVSGGFLDGMIEGFHKRLNIDNAGRDGFPRDQFAFHIHYGPGEDDWTHADTEQTGWNLGNANLSVSFNFGSVADIRPPLIMTLEMKLPTGTRTDYFGGQSVDVALSASSGFATGPLHWYLSSALAYYGDEEMIWVRLRQWHFSGQVGLEFKPRQSSHAWTAQLLTESGVAHNLHQFSEATWELLFGYKRRLADHTSLEIGVLENIFAFDNSPDIGFHSALTFEL